MCVTVISKHFMNKVGTVRPISTNLNYTQGLVTRVKKNFVSEMFSKPLLPCDTNCVQVYIWECFQTITNTHNCIQWKILFEKFLRCKKYTKSNKNPLQRSIKRETQKNCLKWKNNLHIKGIYSKRSCSNIQRDKKSDKK